MIAELSVPAFAGLSRVFAVVTACLPVVLLACGTILRDSFNLPQVAGDLREIKSIFFRLFAELTPLLTTCGLPSATSSRWLLGLYWTQRAGTLAVGSGHTQKCPSGPLFHKL